MLMPRLQTGMVDITPDPDSKFEAYQTISFSAKATEQDSS